MSTTDEPRIPLLDEDEARRRAVDAGLDDSVAALNVFRIWLHHPDLAKRIGDLLIELLGRGKLDRRLRELMIMRLGWATGSAYEWGQHWRIAVERMGLDPADVEAVRDWRNSDRMAAPERAVLAAVDDVVATGVVSPEAFEAIRVDVSDDPMIVLEVVHVAAIWTLVSTVLRSLEVPLEDGMTAWPPDGRAPG